MSPGPIQLDQATALTLMLGPNGSVGIQARHTKSCLERSEKGPEICGPLDRGLVDTCHIQLAIVVHHRVAKSCRSDSRWVRKARHGS